MAEPAAPTPRTRPLQECDLYPPVKAFLESLGYEVKGEVKDCDVTAVRDDELIVVELKTGFTIELLFQASRRQLVADGVYVAIPLPKGGYRAPRHDDIVRLCRRLEIGLLFVAFTESGVPQVDAAVHPAPVRAVRTNAKKRLAVLTEHRGRTGSRNAGGVVRRKILTVYKERSLAIVAILAAHGELTTTQIRALGGPDNTSAILARNYYSWFAKGSPRHHVTVPAGVEALAEHADLFGPPSGAPPAPDASHG